MQPQHGLPSMGVPQMRYEAPRTQQHGGSHLQEMLRMPNTPRMNLTVAAARHCSTGSETMAALDELQAICKTPSEVGTPITCDTQRITSPRQSASQTSPFSPQYHQVAIDDCTVARALL